MERNVIGALGRVGAGAALLLTLGCDARPMTQNEIQNRDRILATYHFTYNARRYLSSNPVYLHDEWIRGGGLAHEEWDGTRWAECGQETGARRDEACLHEISHLWNFHQAGEDPRVNDQIVDRYRSMASHRPQGDYWHDLVFGNGHGWEGMGGNATELYASGASASMGDLSRMPLELVDLYDEQFER